MQLVQSYKDSCMFFLYDDTQIFHYKLKEMQTMKITSRSLTIRTSLFAAFILAASLIVPMVQRDVHALGDAAEDMTLKPLMAC